MSDTMNNREAIEIMGRCKDEIQTLRARIYKLQPKADAYDNLAIVLHLENLVWILEKRIRELNEVPASLTEDPA